MATTKHTVNLTHVNEDSVNLNQAVADPIYQNIVKNYNSIINDLEDIKKELKKQQSNGFTGNLRTKIGTYLSKTNTYIEREKNKQANLKTKYNNAVNRLALSLTETLNDIIKNDKALEGKTPSEVLGGLLTGAVSIGAADMARLQETIATGNSTVPGGSTTPNGSTTPTDPTTPDGSTTPADPTTPNGSTTPADPTTPNGSTTPADPTTPNGSTTPADPTTPINSTTPNGSTTTGIDVGNMTLSEWNQLSPVDKNTVNNIMSGNITATIATDGSNVNYFTDSSGISYPIMGEPVVILGNGTAVKVPITSTK